MILRKRALIGIEKRKVHYPLSFPALAYLSTPTAALYLYRHRRKTLLGHGTDESTASKPEDAQTESRGVRICIPLARIREYQSEWWAAFASILSLAIEHHQPGLFEAKDAVTPGGLGDAVKDLFNTFLVDGKETPAKEKDGVEGRKKKRDSWVNFMSATASPQTSQVSALSPVTSRGTDASSIEGSRNIPPSPGPSLRPNSFASGDLEPLSQVLHLSILQRDPKWDQFGNLVKARREGGTPTHAQVVMDWGELVFDEHAGLEEVPESSEVKVETEHAEMSSAEKKVRRMFALGNHQTVWGESPFLFVC